MKVLILAVFLVCAWAQYNVNLCDPSYACPNGENCGDQSASGWITDRTGWTCVNQKCVAPQCSNLGPGSQPNAFAPQCTGNSYCQNFVCEGGAPTVPEPQPQPSAQLTNFQFPFGISAAGSVGDDCTDNSECTFQFCNDSGKCDTPKKFSPTCPVACNYDDECFQGTCGDNGQCSRSSFRQNLGAKCGSDSDCFSNSCVGGVCSGTDCTNFKCTNAGYYCDYTEDSKNNPSCICFPDYKTFACDPTTKYAYRVDVQTVMCADKKQGGETCSEDEDCVSAWCQTGTCAQYTRSAIPEGQYCSSGLCAPGLFCNSQKMCSTGNQGSNCYYVIDCGSNLICNSSYKCTPGQMGDTCTYQSDCGSSLYCNGTNCEQQIDQVGAICSVTFTNQCVEGLYCLTSNGGVNYTCEESPTLGQTCGWDINGVNNCTASLGETCACFAADTGSNVPRCVSTQSQYYNDQYDKYFPTPVPATSGSSSVSIGASSEAIACEAQQFNLDFALAGSLSSVLAGPYLRSLGSCPNFLSGFGLSSNCLVDFAKFYCCNLCSGILDEALALYPTLDRDAKIFSSQFISPVATLSCAPPTVTLNPDSCDGPQLYSMNQILAQLNCANAPKPSYGKVTVLISYVEGQDVNYISNILNQIITNVLTAKGFTQPDSITVTPDSKNPTTGLDVTLVYAGPNNDQSNLDDAKTALSSPEFTNAVTAIFPASTIGQPTTSSIQGNTGSGAQSTIIFSMISLIAFVLIGLIF